MTDKLPPNLLALFAPRPALRYLPPADHAPESRKTPYIDGVASYVSLLKEKAQKADAAEKGQADQSDPEFERPPTESWLEARDRKTIEKQKQQTWLVTDGVKELYKPSEDQNIRGDAFKTLFVARLPYDAEVKDLEREFGRFGPIERVRIVTDNGQTTKKRKGKSRGYAFVVFEKERDMKAAYKETESLFIKGRRVLVDVERGRTVSGWKPRRFGGGLGGRGYTKAEKARPAGFGPPSGPGGFRGGFRGGYGRGGMGFQSGGGRGGGDFRGRRGGYDSFDGPRGGGGPRGVGYHGSGMPPNGAPAGPRSGGGYGGRGYDDRGGGARNANYEPLPPRGGYRDRDGGGGGGDRGGGGYSGQKRPHDGSNYDDRGPRRRY